MRNHSSVKTKAAIERLAIEEEFGIINLHARIGTQTRRLNLRAVMPTNISTKL